MLEALKSLSTFFNENNLRSRRNLRSDIERRSLSINEEFVDSFKAVNEVTKSLSLFLFNGKIGLYLAACCVLLYGRYVPGILNS